jgi:hypothetical protein
MTSIFDEIKVDHTGSMLELMSVNNTENAVELQYRLPNQSIARLDEDLETRAIIDLCY